MGFGGHKLDMPCDSGPHTNPSPQKDMPTSPGGEERGLSHSRRVQMQVAEHSQNEGRVVRLHRHGDAPAAGEPSPRGSGRDRARAYAPAAHARAPSKAFSPGVCAARVCREERRKAKGHGWKQETRGAEHEAKRRGGAWNGAVVPARHVRSSWGSENQQKLLTRFHTSDVLL